MSERKSRESTESRRITEPGLKERSDKKVALSSEPHSALVKFKMFRE